MIYKESEILARVYQTGSDLYELDDEGELTEKVDGCHVDNDDKEIVWYEVEAVDPRSGMTQVFCELKTLQDAKDVVDRSIEFMKKNPI